MQITKNMKHVCSAAAIALVAFVALTACEKQEKGPVKLAAPSPVLVNAGIDNATFLWESVKGADSYQVVVNDGEPVSVKGVNYTVGKLESSTPYTMKMKAVAPSGSKSWLDSDWSEVLSFTTAGKKVLSTPVLTVTNVLAGGFTVSWQEVKNAGKYVYKIDDGQEMQTTGTSFTADGLKHSTVYTVKVKAVPSEAQAAVAVESAWAETTVETQHRTDLQKPVLASSDIHTNGFTVSWAAVSGAGAYNYKLDGGTVNTTTELSVVFNSLAALSQHTVEVQAAPSEANLDNYVNSGWSSIKVTTLDLVALAAPVLKEGSVLGTEFTVTWDAVPHAARYMCSMGNAEATPVSATSIKYEGLQAETQYTVKVYAVPSDAESVTYKAGPVASINVTTKKAPSSDDKDGGLSDFEEKPVF